MKKTDLKYFDRRVAKRYIDNGFINQEDLDKFVKNLPDDSENMETVSFDDLDPPPSEEHPSQEQAPDATQETQTESIDVASPDNNSEEPTE